MTPFSRLNSFAELVEGFYLVNSGATGITESFVTIGAIYASIICTSAMIIRRTLPGYVPPGFTPPVPGTGGAVKGNVHVNNLLKTPQFWLLFSTSSELYVVAAKPSRQNLDFLRVLFTRG